MCQRMGIVAQEQQVTDGAIGKFVSMFQGRLPDIAVAPFTACSTSTATWEQRLKML